MRTNRQKGIIGINSVEKIVVGDWNCNWQKYDHENDEGFDGIIMMRKGQKKDKATGGVLFVQVKCGGDGYRQDQARHPKHIGVNVGRGYLEAHRPRWNLAPGAAVLVFVDDTIDSRNPPAWWVNLKDESSYSKTNSGLILIPKSQRFGAHSKGEFHQLCGSGPRDRVLQSINVPRDSDLKIILSRNESLRNDAWEFYKHWREKKEDCTNPTLGKVLVNRVGWKHITRPGRRAERIVQSWILLPAARQLVKQVKTIEFLRLGDIEDRSDGSRVIVDYLGLRAKVTFTYRHESVIQVVLKRLRILNSSTGDKEKIWFYSVYELRRGGSGSQSTPDKT